MELPRIEKAYRKYRSQGLVAVGITCGGRKELVEKYARDMRLTFHLTTSPIPAGYDFRIRELYGVKNIPTTILVDAEGKVLLSDLRYDDEDLKAALARAGIH